jgi:hypothetical protein
MGTAALRRDKYRAVRTLLHRLECEARSVHPVTGDSSDPNAASIFRQAVEDPAMREELIAFIGPFLARAVTGSVPDYSIWEPPTRSS